MCFFYRLFAVKRSRSPAYYTGIVSKMYYNTSIILMVRRTRRDLVFKLQSTHNINNCIFTLSRVLHTETRCDKRLSSPMITVIYGVSCLQAWVYIALRRRISNSPYFSHILRVIILKLIVMPIIYIYIYFSHVALCRFSRISL